MTNAILLLLVEDEPLIMMTAEEALVEGGFEVSTALNGSEAIDRLREYPNFAGLVTDVRLAGEMNGWDVARRAREVNPSAAIVYITGDSAARWAAHGLPGSQFLQKPFANAQLVTAISTLLTQSDSSLPR